MEIKPFQEAFGGSETDSFELDSSEAELNENSSKKKHYKKETRRSEMKPLIAQETFSKSRFKGDLQLKTKNSELYSFQSTKNAKKSKYQPLMKERRELKDGGEFRLKGDLEFKDAEPMYIKAQDGMVRSAHYLLALQLNGPWVIVELDRFYLNT